MEFIENIKDNVYYYYNNIFNNNEIYSYEIPIYYNIDDNIDDNEIDNVIEEAKREIIFDKEFKILQNRFEELCKNVVIEDDEADNDNNTNNNTNNDGAIRLHNKNKRQGISL